MLPVPTIHLVRPIFMVATKFQTAVDFALENIGDVDYRVHGSGLNGASKLYSFLLYCFLGEIDVGGH